jgi:glycosyltransferase involved in cell wall biosynthesis
MKARLLFIVNEASYFRSHRLPVALAAKAAGYEVHVACASDDFGIDLSALGIQFHRVPVARGGTNPFWELRAIWSLWRLFRRLRPSLVHLVTVKPVVYGGIAARLAGVPAVVSAVAGLGSLFGDGGGWKVTLIRSLLSPMVRIACGHRNQMVILQNPDDRRRLLQLARIEERKTALIRGSGVDLRSFPFIPEPSGTRVVVMASRLLRDKGVEEFVSAANLLRARGMDVRFWLVGDLDPKNPTSVTPAQLSAWKQEGVVECLGYCTDIPRLYAESHVVTLPSYHEGLPRSLIEAAACGRPVVTTDAPGCRDAIEPNVTGLLVPVRDATALADALARLLNDDALRLRMGTAGRELAEREYRIEKVVESHMNIYRKLAG